MALCHRISADLSTLERVKELATPSLGPDEFDLLGQLLDHLRERISHRNELPAAPEPAAVLRKIMDEAVVVRLHSTRWRDGQDAVTALSRQVDDLREELASAYIRLSGTLMHSMDCATSVAPAEHPGVCDCGHAVTWPLEVRAEMLRARGLHPSPDLLVTAFTEEAGEVVKAVLDSYVGKGPVGDVRKELIQAGAMIGRLLEEGDPIHNLIPTAKLGPFGCRCQTLAHRVTGDGCDICNPEHAAKLAEDKLRPHCCKPGCDQGATWQAYGEPQAGPADDTQACDSHLGHLLELRPHRVEPVAGVAV